MHVDIREAVQTDLPAISHLIRSSFGQSEGSVIVHLIADLLADETAQPVLSLVACVDAAILGHVLFSKARLKSPSEHVSAALLAPLAVHPDVQSQGIGGQLVAEGLKRLAETGVDLVFVLGHPGYYRRFDFSAAGIQGFQAPHPIPPNHAEAWMVRQLQPGIIGNTSGEVICADAIADARFWRE